MNSLLLISGGLGAIQEFVETTKIPLLFIPTAANLDDNPWWVKKDRETLKHMGFVVHQFDSS